MSFLVSSVGFFPTDMLRALLVLGMGEGEPPWFLGSFLSEGGCGENPRRSEPAQGGWGDALGSFVFVVNSTAVGASFALL